MSFIECNCDRLSGNCDDAGKCSCKLGFDGNKCNKCSKGYFGYPHCQGILFFQFLLEYTYIIFFLLSILSLL